MAAWQVMTADNPTDPPNIGWYTSIEVDSKNRPHISYLEYTNYDLRYAYLDKGEWVRQVVDSAGSVGWYSSLELDSHDRPHIAYLDSTNSTLKYASFDGNSWTIESVDSGGASGGASLTLDSNDRPHISYQEHKSAYLKHAYYNGTSWIKETVDSSASIGDFTSIDLDSSNRPAIAYYDDTNDVLKYAKFDGSKWNIETDKSGESAWFPSLELDTNDRPHISYYEPTGQNLKYIYFDGSAWQKDTVDTQGDVGWYTSLELDNDNNPHLSYLDNTNFYLKYATKSGGSWAVTTVDSTAFVGWYTSIDKDDTGRVHISYHGATDTDLRYAFINRVPVLSPIGDKSIAEGKTLSFTISATDEDGDPLIFSVTHLPAGAEFNSDTATFSWTPGLDQAGVYPEIIFEASDGFEMDSETITITVTQAKQPPVLQPIGNKTITEGDTLTFIISATDPDGDPLTYSASNLPTGASFNASTRTFSWKPGFDQAGTYTGVHFQVSDDTATDSEDISITVTNAGPPLAPGLIEPEYGEAGIPLTPTFSWQPGKYTEYSRLQIATDPSFSQLVADIPQLTQNSYTLQSLLSYGTTYYWQVIASNFDGQTTSETYGFITLESPETHDQISTFQLPEAKGVLQYRMFSLPIYPENPDPQAVLGDDLGSYNPAAWRLFHYNPGTKQYNEYPHIPFFAPGLGYWIIVKAGGFIDVRGRAADTSQPFIINLEPGWNQIGNPFKFLVDWGKVKVRQGSTEVLLSDPANTWVDNALWEYQETGDDEAEYELEDEFIPWHGYWVYNRSPEPVALIIPNKTVIETGATTATVKVKARQAMSSPQNWHLKIGATQGSFGDSCNFLGVAEGASRYRDAQDLSEPPPILSEQVRLYFIHLEGEEDSHQYATDYRPPTPSEGVYEFIVESGNKDSTITLSWSKPAMVPQTCELLLSDLTTGKVINMREGLSYSFYPGTEGKRYFKIAVTNTSGVMEPSVKNIINQTVVNKGDTLQWDIVLDGLGKVDGYLGIVFPSGDFFCLLDLDGNTGALNNVAPVFTDWSIVAGTLRPMSYPFTGEEPKGDYQLFVILTKPGSDPLDDRNWLAYDSTPLTVR